MPNGLRNPRTLAVGYCNINRSDLNTHVVLQYAGEQKLDMVFIGEPRIVYMNGAPNAVNHPSFRRCTRIQEDSASKVMGYISTKANAGMRAIGCTLMTKMTGYTVPSTERSESQQGSQSNSVIATATT